MLICLGERQRSNRTANPTIESAAYDRRESARELISESPVPARKRVFIADDDREMCEMIASCLELLDVDVKFASTGEALLELLRNETSAPDLVITDVQMPGISGLDVLAEVKEMFPRVPVVLITAYGDSLVHARARDLGALRCFNKPFNLLAFQSDVAKALESQSLT